MPISDLSRRQFLIRSTAAGALVAARPAAAVSSPPGALAAAFDNSRIQIVLGTETERLWGLRTVSGRLHWVAAPVFCVDGRDCVAVPSEWRSGGAALRLANGSEEHTFSGVLRGWPGLTLKVQFRLGAESPIVRFRYTLSGNDSHRLTRRQGSDALTYAGISLKGMEQLLEVRVSSFVELSHSYQVVEAPLSQTDLRQQGSVAGPIFVAGNGSQSLLLAYEHGAPYPERFLQFEPAAEQRLHLTAVKGNYLDRQPLSSARGFTSPWLQLGALDQAMDQMAAAYRHFALHDLAFNPTSRFPFLYYNTWNFQERNKWWNARGYLDSMNNERLLAEIDAAHEMGIDVFVIDTGWYDKTGDWQVSRARFPDGLLRVRERLAHHGMKLGLWFNPIAAASSSRLLQEHRDCILSRHGREAGATPIWETEASYPMCLVSRYSDALAARLVEVARELDVSYFKWDAWGGSNECDAANHWHGDASHSPEERADSYTFQLVQQAARVMDHISAALPHTIVDNDMTEAGRRFGLQLLASGKYFLINNGPYFYNFNIPVDGRKQDTNVFFYPGPARNWVCRLPLSCDRWIPSVLNLVHYFPDDPQALQELSLASLVLGHNGIWGDLPGVSPQGRSFIGEVLRRYKQVREDMAAANPVTSGVVSSSPEVHEKILASSGRGGVSIFATTSGRYCWRTHSRVAASHWASEGIAVQYEPDGHARLTADFAHPGAKLVLFGIS